MAASYRHWRAADYRVMPWKNGGGSTTELWVEPPAAKVAEGFLWRLSIAKMTGSGPFSAFPGIDRTLIQLAGPALRLEHGGGLGVQVLTPMMPYGFPGEWETSGVLASAAEATDFNVMVRRGAVVAYTEVVYLGEARSILRSSPQGWVAVYVVSGGLLVSGHNAGTGDLVVFDFFSASGGGEAFISGPAGRRGFSAGGAGDGEAGGVGAGAAGDGVAGGVGAGAAGDGAAGGVAGGAGGGDGGGEAVEIRGNGVAIVIRGRQIGQPR